MDAKKLVRDSLKYALPSLPLMYLGFFIDSGSRSYTADLTGRFFNAILANQYDVASGLLGSMIAMVVVCTIFLPLLVLGSDALFFRLSLKYDLKVTSAFFSKRYDRMKDFAPGEVVQRLFMDPGDLMRLIAVTPTNMLAQVSAYILMVFFMARISPMLCVACVFFGLTGAICPLILRRKLAEMDAARKALTDQTAGKELELIRQYGFFRSYGIEKMLPQEQQVAYEEFRETKLRWGIIWDAVSGFITQMCLLLGNIIFLIVGFWQVSEGALGAGNIVAFFTYLGLSSSLVTRTYDLARQMYQMPDNITRVKRLVGDVEQPGEPFKGEWKRINVTDVFYRYQPDADFIRYKNICIDRDDCVELRGDNGCGKTTLVRLLCGLLTPEKGNVRVDGRNIDRVDQRQWRAGIGYVEQLPTVFPGTIRENIRIGNLVADEARVDEVLIRLHLDSEAERVIQGAGELSGGEIKRISLGRALLKDADLLILDEPFEHLDEQGRTIVNELLKDKRKTRICIVHGEDSVPYLDKRVLL